MRIAIGADHAGIELKKDVCAALRDWGYEVLDVGTHNTEPVDYPDYAEAVGVTVLQGKAERGIVICGSGVGASVAANKIPGVRAGLCHDTYSAHQGVEHDDMNVLVLGERVIGPELARELVTAYLGATFTGEERHEQEDVDHRRRMDQRLRHVSGVGCQSGWVQGLCRDGWVRRSERHGVANDAGPLHASGCRPDHGQCGALRNPPDMEPPRGRRTRKTVCHRGAELRGSHGELPESTRRPQTGE